MNLPNATIRTVAVPAVVVAAVSMVMYPEILALVRGDPLGNGITDIVVGVLSIALYVGFEAMIWLSSTHRIKQNNEKRLVLTMLAIAIVINVVLIYSVPNSPEAVGMLLVCAAGALIIFANSSDKQTRSHP